MNDQTANAPLTQAEGLAVYKASKAASAANPLSDAARTLGQRARDARQERQAEPARDAREAPDPEQAQYVEDDAAAAAGVTQDDSIPATGEHPTAAETGAEQDEPGDARTIDLGNGVKVTLDEVRDGFMMKADHTRKTQALADERRSFDADRKQRVRVVDTLIGALRQEIGQPKDLASFVQELGGEEGIRHYAAQEQRLKKLAAALDVRQQEEAHNAKQLLVNTVATLAQKHGDKAAARYADAVKHAAAATGLDANYLAGQMAHPWVIETVHKARAWDDLQAKAGDVKRTIAGVPKVTRPGARVSPQAAGQAALQNAHAKLKSSGNPADAVAYLRALRKTGRLG